MNMIKPYAMGGTSLVSSNLAEDDYPAWNAADSYTIGSRCIRTTTHTIYEAITGGVNSTPPEDALGGDAPQWIAVKSTNRWAMFNDSINDYSTSTEDIVVELALDGAEGLAVMGVVGESISIVVRDNISNSVIYSSSTDLDRSVVTDFYDWFFVPVDQTGQRVVTDLPGWYTDTTATVTISASAGGAAGCGVLKFGEVKDLGVAEAGAKLSMVDYSITEADSFGYLQVVERPYIYTLSVKLIMSKSMLRSVSTALSDVRSTPTIYIPSTDADLDPLVIYGIGNDLSFDIAYYTTHYCTLEIRGMI